MTAERGQEGTWRHLGLWEHGQLHLGATLAHLPADDLHAAALIAGQIWPGQLHHATDLGRWYVWDGRCHRPDDNAAADRRVDTFAAWSEQLLHAARQQVTAEVITQMPGAGQAAVEAAVRAAWQPWEPAARYAAGLRKTAGATALRTRLAWACGTPESWLEDCHPDYLNVANGILHLPTLTLHRHDPAAGLTYCLDVPYDSSAACPRYAALLLRACGGNAAVARYLVKVLGYSMTGGNPRQLVFFLRGPTASGKSALLNVAVAVLGALAHESVTALVCVKRERNARVEYSIRGKRLVTITETSGFLNLDEAQLKRLTGERVIAVDRHYAKEQLRTRVSWTIIIATNEMPALANPDPALQRRMVVIPMGDPVPELERVTDVDASIAAAEGPGVLALLAWGAQAALAEGLAPPPEVAAATAEYVAEQDTVANFLAECAVMGQHNGQHNGQLPPRASQHLVWEAYQWYCRSGPRLPKQEFKRRLAAVPGVAVNDHRRAYEGFQLQPWVAEQVQR